MSGTPARLTPVDGSVRISEWKSFSSTQYGPSVTEGVEETHVSASAASMDSFHLQPSGSDEVQLTPQELVNFLGGGDGSVFGANRRACGRRRFTIRRLGEHMTEPGGGGALAISWPRDDFS